LHDDKDLKIIGITLYVMAVTAPLLFKVVVTVTTTFGDNFWEVITLYVILLTCFATSKTFCEYKNQFHDQEPMIFIL